MPRDKARETSTLVFFRWLQVFENNLVVVLLAALIMVSSGQFLLRNFFSSGVVWAEPVSRMLVLWLGLSGAMLASRRSKHIRIDVLVPYLSERWKQRIHWLVTLVSAAVCLTLAWLATDMVLLEREFGNSGIASIPLWGLQIVIPVSFGVLGIRYLCRAWHGAKVEPST